MKLNRAFLSAELSVLEPAIAEKPEIPGLDLLWFSGTDVLAYNGTIGIKKPLATDFTGGVFGRVLIGYLEKIAADQVELGKLPDVDDFEISAGQSNLRLPLSQIENRLWDLPEYDPSSGFMMTKDFLNLVEMCLVSVNKNIAIHEYTGLTLETTRHELNLYSTDFRTMSWGRLPKPQNYACDYLCITGAFFEQLLKICGAEDYLYLSPTAAIAINKAGTTLYGRILEVEDPKPFQQKITEWINEIDHDMIAIPEGLDYVLDRAELLRQGRVGEPAQLTISDNNLNLYLKTQWGELKDDLALDEGHPKIMALYDTALIKRALAERTFFAMNKRRLIMTGPNSFMHVITSLHS